ncbi:hypothetical protein HanHA89_Chr16g0679491 [Helianthus annuus]|nr:hypothetical protein HanHA89_Chr16g0679491 [Helianthus annuus]
MINLVGNELTLKSNLIGLHNPAKEVVNVNLVNPKENVVFFFFFLNGQQNQRSY